ncbi:MAG: DUF4982 domain-containing protein, partial [Bacteroidaceae bacterium]
FTPEGHMPSELFIASRWDSQSGDTIVVFGNVHEVSLMVNGREIKRQWADHGATTAYVPQHDGGNCEALQFPPFTFVGIPFEQGQLEAIGYDAQGCKVAHAVVCTPDEPARLKLSYFEGGMPAGVNDLLIIYVTLTDAYGVPCHVNEGKVTLHVEGGCVMGPDTNVFEDGVAAFLVKTGDVRKVIITAETYGMRDIMKLNLMPAG